MRLTWFALGVIAGAGATVALIIYARRINALEGLQAHFKALASKPALPPVPPLPAKPEAVARVREIARERAKGAPAIVN